ncbi:MAG: hypothetical protein K6A23_13265 [Butyrivibrio sp.]|nr:hypothetical protein [Butyrivibrio sp.]
MGKTISTTEMIKSINNPAINTDINLSNLKKCEDWGRTSYLNPDQYEKGKEFFKDNEAVRKNIYELAQKMYLEPEDAKEYRAVFDEPYEINCQGVDKILNSLVVTINEDGKLRTDSYKNYYNLPDATEENKDLLIAHAVLNPINGEYSVDFLNGNMLIQQYNKDPNVAPKYIEPRAIHYEMAKDELEKINSEKPSIGFWDWTIGKIQRFFGKSTSTTRALNMYEELMEVWKDKYNEQDMTIKKFKDLNNSYSDSSNNYYDDLPEDAQKALIKDEMRLSLPTKRSGKNVKKINDEELLNKKEELDNLNKRKREKIGKITRNKVVFLNILEEDAKAAQGLVHDSPEYQNLHNTLVNCKLLAQEIYELEQKGKNDVSVEKMKEQFVSEYEKLIDCASKYEEYKYRDHTNSSKPEGNKKTLSISDRGKLSITSRILGERSKYKNPEEVKLNKQLAI